MSMIERAIPKYIPHAETGFPIRLAPYARAAVLEKPEEAQIVLRLVESTPFIGERSENDFAQNNMEHNIKMRRLARQVIGPELVSFAQEKGASRYCALVYGSLSRGLVRHPQHPDASDIDTALVVDDETEVSRAEKEIFEKKLQRIGSANGVPVGCRVHTISRAKQMVGQLAKTYLESSAYALANEGGMWEELYGMGLTTATYTQFGPAERRGVRKLVEEILNHQYESAQKRYHCTISPRPHLLQFITQQGLLDKDAHANAQKLYELIKPNERG